MERQQRVNEQIRIPQVRVIAEDGEQLGIISTDDALRRAREVGLDLVEVAPTERPPVCRIMDFGKFKYQQKKRKEKSHAHQVKNKEIRLRPKTGAHDLEFKINHAREFLTAKDKVIVTVAFKGRENAHPDEGFKLVNTFVKQLEDISKVESGPSMQGKRIILVLSPR